MSRLPDVKPREAIKALERAGFIVHHVRGSHYILTDLRVTVPYHVRSLKKGTLAFIINEAGLTIDEFKALL